MNTLFDIIRRSEGYLSERGIERPRRQAEEVIADALKMNRLDLYLQFERPMLEQELEILRTAIKRRGEREPTAYIAGRVDFADLELKVNSSVLIPRPETEILVEMISDELKELDLDRKILWDVCCGSGCIGIALKRRFPKLKVILSDLSEEALAVARKNAPDEIEIRHGDLLAPFEKEQCDFIVCNPPYVTEKDYQTLAPELFHEPKMALVSGETGLEFYERLARDLRGRLKERGWLEIGSGQGKCVKSIFEKENWRCHYSADWSGHDRFFCVS